MAGSSASHTAVVTFDATYSLPKFFSSSNVSIDHIPVVVLLRIYIRRVILSLILDSDEEARIGYVTLSISGDGVVFVDKLPDDEIVDPRVKVETVSVSASSPPRSHTVQAGIRQAYECHCSASMLNILVQEERALGKTFSNPCDSFDEFTKNVLNIDSAILLYWKLLFFGCATSFDYAVHSELHSCIFDAAAVFQMLLIILLQLVHTFSSSIPADYVPAERVHKTRLGK
ncbi:hypothetical protein Tco_1117662 [Tanacetum coccineum]